LLPFIRRSLSIVTARQLGEATAKGNAGARRQKADDSRQAFA
jgi:hypothetical protein